MRFDWKPESKERWYISNRFRETGKHADGERQRERLRTCMKCLRQKTSSARNTRAFSYMLL